MNRCRIALVVLCALGAAACGADEQPDVAKELKKFAGTWTFESVEAGGKEVPIDAFKGIEIIFEGSKYTVKKGDQVLESATQKLDPTRSPKTFDVTVTEGPNKGSVILGIYEVSEDTLKGCFDPTGKKRPTEFKTAADSPVTLVVHKRVKK